MSEDTIVFIVFIGLIVIGITVAIIRAIFTEKYDDGRHEEYEKQKKYHSWLYGKGVDDLLVRKVFPMITLLSASGNNHTMTRNHFNKYEEFVELEDGAILDKNHIEQKKYFFLGEGIINENGRHYAKKQLMLFKVNGIEFTSKDNIEWMTTYGLYKLSDFDYHIPDTAQSHVLDYTRIDDEEEKEWDERYASYYSRYFLLMDKIHKEELELND